MDKIENKDNSQAQHSPLPWKCHEGRIWHWSGKPTPVAVTDKRDASFLQVTGNCEANAAFIMRACNNAQRLADHCRKLIDAYQWGAKTYGFSCKSSVIEEAREALAQWEGSKQ